PGRLEVLARRFPPDSGLLLDPAQRPAKPPQRQYRLLLFFAQDVDSRRGTTSRRFSSTSWRRRYDWPVFRCPSLAGFGCPPRNMLCGRSGDLAWVAGEFAECGGRKIELIFRAFLANEPFHHVARRHEREIARLKARGHVRLVARGLWRPCGAMHRAL